MEAPLSRVHWIEKNEVLDELLSQEDILTVHPMNQGLEAEVIKISSENESYVLKVWNKESKPDVRFQFHLVHALVERGFSVPLPVGWGINSNSHQMLLTTFNGSPIRKANEQLMVHMANLLAQMHQMDVKELGLPKYDFLDYFFPGAGEHQDIYQALDSLLSLVKFKQERLIHGDFHFENIVEEDGRCTVIDWTNGQLGDPRYDFAWTFILQKIYISERSAEAFRSAYLSEIDICPKDLDVFEALACLRWLLLARRGGTPKEPAASDRAKRLITSHPYLHEWQVWNRA
ncbi:phosphotransferase [Brevibacillus reuszeri]|uniref:phosphotransferase n=1 Tax=Brevibacillus reuszeri TaxID=54915 RepID=UPI001F26CECF|nr:phosphotransferase [Brevibacillus reuszeri]